MNVIDCAPDFAMKALDYRSDFDAVRHRGRFVVVHCNSEYRDRRSDSYLCLRRTVFQPKSRLTLG